MVIWLTGSTGYLGSSFLVKSQKLFPKAKIVALVRKLPSKQTPGVNYVAAGSSDTGFTFEELRDLREKQAPDLICHFATRFHNAYSPLDADAMIDANITFPIRILEACREMKFLRFLNFGTFYSHANGGLDRPASFYAATKRSFESFLNFYTEREGWKAITLKIYDTYGPGDTRAKLVPKWVEILRTGEVMKLSPGDQQLSFVHVDDINSAVARSVEILGDDRFEHGHRIYQLPANEDPKKFPTLKEVADFFSIAAGRPLPVNFGALPYRDVEIMNPSMEFPILPGWTPKVDLVNGFREILSNR
jgi:nucleoside-diphosphate-sugar epimerase